MDLGEELIRASREWGASRNWALLPRRIDSDMARFLLKPTEGPGGRIDVPRLTPLFTMVLLGGFIAAAVTVSAVERGELPSPLRYIPALLIPLLWGHQLFGPELRWDEDHVRIGERRVAWEAVRVRVGFGMLFLRVTDGVGGWAIRPVRGRALNAGRVYVPSSRSRPRRD